VFPIEAFADSVHAIADILRNLAIPFHLTGGITSLAYGEPRMTQDVDLVLDPVRCREIVDGLISALESSRFLFDRATLRAAVRDERQFQLLDSIESLKLDLYPRELIEGELQRSVQFEVFQGSTVPIVSLPDAVISKLLWISNGSHKSRRDVRQLFRACKPAELDSVRVLAESSSLSQLLEEVLSEPDEIDL